ncbi:MAG: helicase-related protein [Candidatus Eisenbacteria bacterium]
MSTTRKSSPIDSDRTFFTNEKDRTLLDRFRVLIRDTRFFDVLVGYFYTSGFHALYRSLESTEKIRILIGISTDRGAADLVNRSKQEELPLSHAETSEKFAEAVVKEMGSSEDNAEVEEGVQKFLEWLRSGKLEIRAFPTSNIHAKVYIMSFVEDDREVGRVITGSSNFTQAGLSKNLEFNVELKNRSDYDFAKEQFELLWRDAVDVGDQYDETVQKRTWLNDTITPYELYLKFLYEYYKDDLTQTEDVLYKYVPSAFMKLEYQEQAVLNAKKIVEEYGGGFLSDVVGLGKTYMAAMLASQLDGRTLVIAPPVLLERENPGSWPNVFSDFHVAADFESLGKLEHLVKRGTEKYKNIFIDEAHRFRTETNVTYEKLAQVCRGKRIILVTATPLNNTPRDILSQIKLFQKSKKSTIPGLPDLETFFLTLEGRLKGLDRQQDREKYIDVSKENAREIRDKVLKYLMVRRTRNEIEKYFREDLAKQKLRFPIVADPEPAYYELDDDEDRIFSETIKLVAEEFKYARYTPMLYYKGDVTQPEKLAQTNLGKFMKILLVKRLESSFYAFRKTVDRFIESYALFLKHYREGNVYVSKKYASKIFELLENDDEERVVRLLEEDKAQCYSSNDFDAQLERDLEHDLAILKRIKEQWEQVRRDPKLLKLIELVKRRKTLQESKIILFTESRETAEYLAKALKDKVEGGVLVFTGDSSSRTRESVIENFDARARYPKDKYRLLIATEVLSEGVNLHRANVVVNYDIPWNPTRLMQRVGRINRVDTKFDKIYSLNFFPTKQSNDQIKLKEAAEAKIHAFISLLGADARLLTEGEAIEHHELFDRLISKRTITGEDEEEESGLKYLQLIRGIRDDEPDLYEHIKRLPRKARTARKVETGGGGLVTYFRKGKLQKFYLGKGSEALELDFLSAASVLEATKKAKRVKMSPDFYPLLELNKAAFIETTTDDLPGIERKGGRDTATQLLRVLKAIRDLRRFTEEQEEYLRRVMRALEEGGLPRQTTKAALREVSKEGKAGVAPLKILGALQKSIPPELLGQHFSESAAQTSGPREVILSELLMEHE